MTDCGLIIYLFIFQMTWRLRYHFLGRPVMAALFVLMDGCYKYLTLNCYHLQIEHFSKTSFSNRVPV